MQCTIIAPNHQPPAAEPVAFHERKAGDRGARKSLETPVPEVQPDGEGIEVRAQVKHVNTLL